MSTLSLVPFTRLRNELEKLFGDDYFSTPTTTTFWAPRVNVRETPDAIEIAADLPGVAREDLQIQVENNQLVIRGKRRDEREDTTGTWHRVEKVYGEFERAFTLPSTLRRDDIRAALKDGILTVTVPKAEEAKPRQVEIKID